MSYTKLPEKPTLAVDVDNTLVFPEMECPPEFKCKANIVRIGGRIWYRHHLHVEMVKDFKARGHTVVVWSAGGSDWAETVVTALKLDKWVDVIIPKPHWHMDDKPSSEWLEELHRIYLLGDEGK